MSHQIRAADAAGNTYEVTDDHAQARLVGTEEWKPMGQLRLEVGPLTLLPQKGDDDA